MFLHSVSEPKTCTNYFHSWSNFILLWEGDPHSYVWMHIHVYLYLGKKRYNLQRSFDECRAIIVLKESPTKLGFESILNPYFFLSLFWYGAGIIFKIHLGNYQ